MDRARAGPAEVRAVAEQSVVAGAALVFMFARTGGLMALIRGAGVAVVAIDRGPGIAAFQSFIAGFNPIAVKTVIAGYSGMYSAGSIAAGVGPVAEQAVVARRSVVDMHAPIHRVASVIRAGIPVITIQGVAVF